MKVTQSCKTHCRSLTEQQPALLSLSETVKDEPEAGTRVHAGPLSLSETAEPEPLSDKDWIWLSPEGWRSQPASLAAHCDICGPLCLNWASRESLFCSYFLEHFTVWILIVKQSYHRWFPWHLKEQETTDILVTGIQRMCWLWETQRSDWCKW